MRLIENIKESEGYKDTVYKDTEGYDTIYYGTKLPISKEEHRAIGELLLTMRLEETKKELHAHLKYLNIAKEAWEILYEMAYQMGVPKFLKFKNTIKALRVRDYKTASVEMLDSKWYRQMHEADMRDGVDSENRAERLARKMREI